MTKTENKSTLTKKPERVKWPLKKFLNKFFVFNIFLTLGIVMLILSLVCQDAFKGDQAKINSNIIVSVLVIVAGLAGGLTYSLLLTYRGEQPLETKFSDLTKWFFWVPILGIVFDKIWKHKELKHQYALKLKSNPNFKKPKMQLPSALLIIFAALVGIVFAIWVIYLAGGNLIVTNTEGEQVPGQIPGLLDIFLNPLRGFAGYNSTNLGAVSGAASIVIFLLLFNACMELVSESKALEAGIGALLKKMKGKEIILIPILMFILSICGSTFNMCEQLLPLFLVVIPLLFAAGYDAMTGFMVVFMSAGVGVMGSTVNPVLISTAIEAMKSTTMDPALIPGMMVGITWRLVIFAVVTIASIACTMIYALRMKKNPQKSCVYMSNEEFKSKYSFDKDALPPMTTKRMWTLIVFGVTFLMLIICLIDWKEITGWTGFIDLQTWLANTFPFLTSICPIGSFGMLEAGFLFFVGAVLVGVINWKSAPHFMQTFLKGCADFIGVAFIVSLARGLAITLNESGFNNLIADGLGAALKHMPAIGAMLMIFLVVSLLTIFIPSSSGLSSAMFPIIGPTVGGLIAGGVETITVSGSVTTFAAAMGWVNLFTPTGMVLPFLEMLKMDYSDFVKASWKQILIVLVVGLGLMAIGCYLPAGMF